MRAVLQRVSSATVRVQGRPDAVIGPGLVALVAAAAGDAEADLDWLAAKMLSLKLFDTPEGAWRADLATAGGDLLLVSQFTLLASCRKGTRPSWHRAAAPETGRALFDSFHEKCEALLGRKVKTGEFGAHMEVGLVNDGPVTIILDSKLRE